MALVLYWANPAGMFYVGVMIFVGAGVYFGVLVLLRGFGGGGGWGFEEFC